jgi:hypothetical protein
VSEKKGRRRAELRKEGLQKNKEIKGEGRNIQTRVLKI